MHKLICQTFAEQFLTGLFKIGVVGENVNKILNHSVAEVVLLLQGKAEGEVLLSIYMQKWIQTTQM